MIRHVPGLSEAQRSRRRQEGPPLHLFQEAFQSAAHPPTHHCALRPPGHHSKPLLIALIFPLINVFV